MSETYRADEAARMIVAGLKMLREHAKRSGLPITAMDLIYHAESRISDECVLPWEPKESVKAERPERDLPWSAVLCGDEVLAPNGQWYGVDSWSRTGRTVKALLKNNGTVATVRDAGEVVRVRRGPAGQAADMFTDAGFNLEVLAA